MFIPMYLEYKSASSTLNSSSYSYFIHRLIVISNETCVKVFNRRKHDKEEVEEEEEKKLNLENTYYSILF